MTNELSALDGWTRTVVYSPPNDIGITYVRTNGDGTREEVTVEVRTTTQSVSEILYTTIRYEDASGMPQVRDVQRLKTDTTYTSLPAANQSLVAWTLQNGGAADTDFVITKNITTYQYKTTTDGPELIQETTENYISQAQFAGGLGITDYSTFTPSKSYMVLSTKTIRVINLLKDVQGRDTTKTQTSRWMARGETSEGKTYFANALRKSPSLINLSSLVHQLESLVFEGTEIQIEVGRVPVPVKPSDQDIARDEIANGLADDGTSDGPVTEHFVEGVVLFDGAVYESDNSIVTAQYTMPYAPDDHFEIDNGTQVLVPGGAEQAATAFGQLESALDIGHAFGQNIVTGWNEAPSLDLAPLYIQLAGIEGAFLADSVQYAWGPEGMVVSSDLMLLGVVGWYGSSQPASSWLQLPMPASGLQQVAAPTTGTAQKANSIAIPEDIDYRDPADVLASLPTNGSDSWARWRSGANLIAPTLTLENKKLYTRPLIRFSEYPYAFDTESDIQDISTNFFADDQSVTSVDVPAAAVNVASLAPDVVTAPILDIPSCDLQIAAIAPAVYVTTAVDVPAAALQVAGVAPALVGAQTLQVLVPAAEITIAGAAPSSAGPVAATDPSFASVSLLLHMNGSNNSTTFTDSGPSVRTITRAGDSKILTAQSKYGGASGYFDGTGDYLSCTISPAVGTGAYTLEGWFRASDTTNWRSIFAMDGLTIYWHQGAVVGYGGGLSGSDLRSRQGTFGPEAALATNTWHHFALVRETSGAVHIFANGVKGGLSNGAGSSASGNTFNFSGGSIRIASNSSNGEVFFGYLDDIRITRGVARYTATFTPPTAEFPDA